MTLLLTIVGAYLVVGGIALALFELKTGRIHNKLGSAALDTQNTLAPAGLWLRSGTAKMVILIVTWLFWPILFYGAAEAHFRDRSAGK